MAVLVVVVTISTLLVVVGVVVTISTPVVAVQHLLQLHLGVVVVGGVRLLSGIEHADIDPVGQESDAAAGIGVVLVGPQGVEFGLVDLLDVSLAVAVGDVDRPHAVAGFTRGLRFGPGLGPRAPGELVEEDAEAGLLLRAAQELAESVAQAFAGVAQHAIEFVGVEPERSVVLHT